MTIGEKLIELYAVTKGKPLEAIAISFQNAEKHKV
jgi:hypothetical protein